MTDGLFRRPGSPLHVPSHAEASVSPNRAGAAKNDTECAPPSDHRPRQGGAVPPRVRARLRPLRGGHARASARDTGTRRERGGHPRGLAPERWWSHFRDGARRRRPVVPEIPDTGAYPPAAASVLQSFTAIPVLLAAAGLFVLEMALASRYGFHRDELYFLDCARHLQGGYVDQPILTPLLARATPSLMGDNVAAPPPLQLKPTPSVVSATKRRGRSQCAHEA